MITNNNTENNFLNNINTVAEKLKLNIEVFQLIFRTILVDPKSLGGPKLQTTDAARQH